MREPRRPWTPTDDGVLLAYVGSEPLARLARRLGRTERAVEQRAYGRGLALSREAQRGVGMSMAAATELLGVDPKTMWRWAKRGWIAVVRTRGRRAARYAVAEVEIASFLDRVGGLLPEVRPSDAAWREVRDEARARLLARYISAQELVRLLGYAHHNRLLVWRRRRGFPAPALDVGERSGGHYYERAAVATWLAAHPTIGSVAGRAALGVSDAG